MLIRPLLFCAVWLTAMPLRAQAPAAAAPPASASQTAGSTPGMTLVSSGFDDGGIIPGKYSAASAAPVSPPLSWDNVPAETASFVLIVHDPDTAPEKSTTDVLHWLVFNIPGRSRALNEGIAANEQLADGSIQGKNFGKLVGYRGMGARAPGPYHHYTFELFAVDMKLSLGPDASRADVLKAIDGHILAKAALVGRFHR